MPCELLRYAPIISARPPDPPTISTDPTTPGSTAASVSSILSSTSEPHSLTNGSIPTSTVSSTTDPSLVNTSFIPFLGLEVLVGNEESYCNSSGNASHFVLNIASYLATIRNEVII